MSSTQKEELGDAVPAGLLVVVAAEDLEVAPHEDDPAIGRRQHHRLVGGADLLEVGDVPIGREAGSREESAGARRGQEPLGEAVKRRFVMMLGVRMVERRVSAPQSEEDGLCARRCPGQRQRAGSPGPLRYDRPQRPVFVHRHRCRLTC